MIDLYIYMWIKINQTNFADNLVLFNFCSSDTHCWYFSRFRSITHGIYVCIPAKL